MGWHDGRNHTHYGVRMKLKERYNGPPVLRPSASRPARPHVTFFRPDFLTQREGGASHHARTPKTEHIDLDSVRRSPKQSDRDNAYCVYRCVTGKSNTNKCLLLHCLKISFWQRVQPPRHMTFENKAGSTMYVVVLLHRGRRLNTTQEQGQLHVIFSCASGDPRGGGRTSRNICQVWMNTQG